MNWQPVTKSMMAAAAILKSTLFVEPPSREMNSLFVIFNQKCSFLGYLTFKGSLLSGALMIQRFFARNRLSPDFYGSKFGGILNRRPPHSEFEGTKPQKARNTTFEPLSVQFGPKFRPVGWPRKREKKAGEESHKTVIFHYHVDAPCHNRCAPNWVSL